MPATLTFSYANIIKNLKIEDVFPKDIEETQIETLLQAAREEVRENDEIREQSLTHFRTWIKQNQDISNCITDDSFLLRFLRVKKFSLPMAQQMLLKYLNFRRRFSYLTSKLDYTDEKALELINNGYIFVCPLRDQFGRRVIITNLNKFDPYKYTSAEMARAHVIAYETLIDDEENQLLGFNHVGSGHGASPAYVGLWSISEFATLLKWGEHSYPIRHKACHIINLPTAVKHVIDFALTRVSDKLKQRLFIHNSKEDLHNHVPVEVLPKEYGGILPSAVMIEMWKKEMEAKRSRLLSYDQMELLTDRGIMTRRNEYHMEDMQGSFRKLNVD